MQNEEIMLVDGAMPMKIGKEEYLASMLTDRDFGDLDRFIQSLYIKMGWEAADLLSDEKSKQELRQLTLRNATTMSYFSEEGINLSASQDGLLHLGFQMCRKRQPNLKYYEFEKEALKNITLSLAEINKVDKFLNYSQNEKDGQESGGTPTVNQKSE